MKKSLFIVLIASLFTFNGLAHNNFQKDKEEWKQKIMSEKIAFLTTEIGISPEEGQVFWPVYNEINKEKDEIMRQVFRNYRALNEAIENSRPEKEIKDLLDKYLESMEDQRELENDAADKYMKVLPVEKVAKLYIAEEKFRRHQIHRLNDGKGPQAKR